MQETRDMIDRLNLSGKRLSKGHRKIAEYIVDHYDKAVFMTASTLGEMVGVSESTVVRFAVALGYEGYPQLQKSLQELVRHRLTSVQRFEMSSEISQGSVLQTVLKADMQNIRNTIDEIDAKAFNEMVERILSAQHVYIIGLRAASMLARFFGFYLNYILDDVRIVADNSTDVYESIARIGEKDVLIGISFPRYSTRTLDAMRFAKRSKAQVLGITDGPMSPMHQEADICLSARTDIASFVDSFAAPLSVINALIVAVGLQRKEELSKHFKQLEGIWSEHSVYLNKENQP